MKIGKPNVEGNFWGCRIEGFFFEPECNNLKNINDRLFPFVTPEQRKDYKFVIGENDKLNIGFGDIIAQPDAVFNFKFNSTTYSPIPEDAKNSWFNGYISMEYKSLSGSRAKRVLHTPDKWRHQIRIKDVLQCIITSLQVSIHFQGVTLPVLRYVNSAYAIYPTRELIEFIIDKAPKVKKYLEEERFVSASQLSEHLASEVERHFKKENSRHERAKETGAANHDKMLG